MSAKIHIIDLGGSLIVPDHIDTDFLARFREILTRLVKKGNRVVIICGGGSTARHYQQAARTLNPKSKNFDLDNLGIEITKVNALFLRDVFGNLCAQEIFTNPHKKIRTPKKIIIGAGWKPGMSTDAVAALAAKTYGAKSFVDLSNIDYIYTQDPNRYQSARPIKKMSWGKLQELIGRKWTPGANTPVDPYAMRLGKKYRLTMVVMKGSDLKNFEDYLNGKKFVGTIVS